MLMAFHVACTKAHTLTSTYKHVHTLTDTSCVRSDSISYTDERNVLEQKGRRLRAGSSVVCQFQSTVHTFRWSVCMCVSTLWACAKHVIVYLNISRIIRACYVHQHYCSLPVLLPSLSIACILMCFCTFCASPTRTDDSTTELKFIE